MNESVDSLISKLIFYKEFYLAQAIKEASSLSIEKWSKLILEPTTVNIVTNTFEESLIEEARYLGYSEELIEKTINSLNSHLVIQTASHSAISQLPRFLFNHYVLSAGMDEKDVLLSGFYSNIPVSNPSYPGSLLFSETEFSAEDIFADNLIARKINKQHFDRKRDIPSTKTFKIPIYQSSFKDSGVDFITSNDYDFELADLIKPELKEKMSFFKKFDMVDASLIFLANLDSLIFKKDTLYFDINRLVKRIFLKDLKSNNFWQYFFWGEKYQKSRSIIEKSKLPLFHQKNKKEYRFNDSFFPIESGGLVSDKNTIINSPDVLIEKLENLEIIPSTFLVMSVLAFQYGIRSLGSFRNIEYIHNYQNFWEKNTDVFLDLNWQKTASVRNLSTGQFIGAESNFHSLDFYLGKKFNPDPGVLMQDCYLEMQDIFLNGSRAGNLFIKN